MQYFLSRDKRDSAKPGGDCFHSLIIFIFWKNSTILQKNGKLLRSVSTWGNTTKFTIVSSCWSRPWFRLDEACDLPSPPAINQVRTKVKPPPGICHPPPMMHHIPTPPCSPRCIVVAGGSEVLGLSGQISGFCFSLIGVKLPLTDENAVRVQPAGITTTKCLACAQLTKCLFPGEGRWHWQRELLRWMQMQHILAWKGRNHMSSDPSKFKVPATKGCCAVTRDDVCQSDFLCVFSSFLSLLFPFFTLLLFVHFFFFKHLHTKEGYKLVSKTYFVSVSFKTKYKTGANQSSNLQFSFCKKKKFVFTLHLVSLPFYQLERQILPKRRNFNNRATNRRPLWFALLQSHTQTHTRISFWLASSTRTFQARSATGAANPKASHISCKQQQENDHKEKFSVGPKGHLKVSFLWIRTALITLF